MTQIDLEITLRLRAEGTPENLVVFTRLLNEVISSHGNLKTELSMTDATIQQLGLFRTASSKQSQPLDDIKTMPSLPENGNVETQVLRKPVVERSIEYTLQDLLSVPRSGLQEKFPNYGIPKPNERGSSVGSWGQFNSFFPICAAARIAVNLDMLSRKDLLTLDRFANLSVTQFKIRKLSSARGFPSSDKPTAVGRYVWHFLITAHEMGLIRIINSKEPETLPWSLSDWDSFVVEPTRSGYEFACFSSKFLDLQAKDQVLDQEAAAWIISHLKNIETMGYAEYSFLKNILTFLKKGNNGKEDLRYWLQNNERFKKYVATWSRKASSADVKLYMKQLSNLANTFASSKIALLRELRLVDPRRNHYEVIGSLDTEEGVL